ncbi:MAG: DUF3501 family protein [Haliea sp.]|nr:DUF3501 family protein [Haliea sp.]
MSPLTRADLWSLEQYAEERPRFRSQVLEHKKTRHLALGEHVRLYFEDALTIKYQVQEMLRIEKVFEAAGIIEELDAYNPLIPDGQNWKATFMIEYSDPIERARRLAEMVGIEDKVWLQVGNGEKVYAIADEDLDRSNEFKTSSVHFMRFELTPDMITAAKRGEAIQAGIEHAAYSVESFVIAAPIRDSLTADLQPKAVH